MEGFELAFLIYSALGAILFSTLGAPEWVGWTVLASLALELVFWVLEDRAERLERSEDWDPVAEGSIENEGFDATRTERQQQAGTAVTRRHFARHSRNDSHQEAQTTHGLGQAVGTFGHTPDGTHEWDGPQEAGGAALDGSVIWEQIVGDGVGAEASQSVHDEVSQVEAQVIAVQDSDCCGGHGAFSTPEKPAEAADAVHASLNTAQSISRVPEPGNGLQLCTELGWRQSAYIVRATDPKPGILQFSMDDYSGSPAQLLGGVAQSEDGTTQRRSQSHRPFVKQAN